MYTHYNVGTINEWDTHSLRCIRSVDAMGSPIWCVGVHNAHKRLAAGTDNGKVWVLSRVVHYIIMFHCIDMYV